MHIDELLRHYSLNAPQMMWFLGAGASRSARLPSATDIIWDLKRRYYCLKENRHVSDNELSNEAVKDKIQNYLVSNGCPEIWSEDEYAYYFRLHFGDSPAAHQRYLEERLNPKHISINSGHRIMAALMATNNARIVFTTNFDSVLENAYAFMTGKDLHSFSLDGSYAALNALNNENFPIYAKLHGDFRYFEMKNLPEQLASNDADIENCFINACSRYGLVVCGYSGRDKNVMSMFEKAIEQKNAFPKGLYWARSINGLVFPAVASLIEKAQANGISAHLVEVDTFDTLLGKIWKHMESRPPEYDKKIRRSIYEIPKISRYAEKGAFPVIRSNAFPVLKMPEHCISIETTTPLSVSGFKDRLKNAQSAAIMLKEKTVLAWGSDEEIHKVIPPEEIKSRERIDLKEYLESYRQNSLLNSFLNRAIARALAFDKPLRLRKKRDRYFLVVSSKHPKFDEIEAILKSGLKSYNFKEKKFLPPKWLAGKIPYIDGTFWMEAVEISLDFYDGKFWLILKPEIWVEPDRNRKLASDFLMDKKRSRYNSVQNSALDAWKTILLGSDDNASISAFESTNKNNATFSIGTTTAFSQRVGNA